MCMTWLVHTWDVTHLYDENDRFIWCKWCHLHQGNDWSQTWLIMEMTGWKWLIQMMPRTFFTASMRNASYPTPTSISWVWHESFIPATWLIHMCLMTVPPATTPSAIWTHVYRCKASRLYQHTSHLSCLYVQWVIPQDTHTFDSEYAACKLHYTMKQFRKRSRMVDILNSQLATQFTRIHYYWADSWEILPVPPRRVSSWYSSGHCPAFQNRCSLHVLVDML